jgi:predicted nucleic acid-binding protein
MKHGRGGRLLRVVVDTNVFISAFLYPERPIFQVLQQAGQRRYLLLTSPAIVREVGMVMREDLAWEEVGLCRKL